MAQTTHGVGGLTFDTSKTGVAARDSTFSSRSSSSSSTFEILGRLSARRQLSVQYPRQRRRHLQPAAAGNHHPAGVDRRHHRHRRDAGDHHAAASTCPSGSIVGATAMIAMSLRAGGDRSTATPIPRRSSWSRAGLDLPVIVPILVGHRLRPDGRPHQRLADRLHADSALHRHARHDGDGARHRANGGRRASRSRFRPTVSPPSARD